MQKNEYGLRKVNWVVAVFLFIVSLLAGYYMAAGMEQGFLIYDWITKMQNVVLQQPFQNYWNTYSIPCMVLAGFCYLFGFLYYLTTGKNYMKGREFGTAKFISPEKLNKELANQDNDIEDEHNIVLIGRKKGFKKFYQIERK